MFSLPIPCAMLLPHAPLFGGEHALPCPGALAGLRTWLPLLRTPLGGPLVPLRRLRGSSLALLSGLLPRARLLLPILFFLRFLFLAFLLLLPRLGLLRPLPFLPFTRSCRKGGTGSSGKKKRSHRAHRFNASHKFCLGFFVLPAGGSTSPKRLFFPAAAPADTWGLVQLPCSTHRHLMHQPVNPSLGSASWVLTFSRGDLLHRFPAPSEPALRLPPQETLITLNRTKAFPMPNPGGTDKASSLT